MKLIEPLFVAFVFLNLLQLVRLWDVQFVKSYLYPLAKLMQSQETIWFLSERLTTKNSEHLQEFIVDASQNIQRTQTVLTNRSDLRLTKTQCKKNSIGIVMTTGPEDPIMHVHDRVLLGRHFFFNLIIMVNEVNNFSVIDEFIAGMHKRNFQNSLITFRYTSNSTTSNELFGFTTFPTFLIENRTDFFEFVIRELPKYMSGGMDVKGYEFRSPLRQDVPGVFQYKNVHGRPAWQGTSYSLLKLFTDYVNATLVSYRMPKDKYGGDIIDMKAALDLVRDGKIPLSVHAYALFSIDDSIDKSYPIMVVRWCLMVPIWNSVSTMYYPLEPFDGAVWFGIVSVFVGLVVAKIFSIIRYGDHITQRLTDGFLDSFCFTINIVTAKTIHTPSAIEFFIYATVFFYGFFIAANYTSLLGSIFTVTLFRAQINTMQDLINANISVMIIDYELQFLLHNGNDLPWDFYHLLYPVDSATFTRHQLALNSTYAYFITDDKWHFLNHQQKYLKQGIFKFTDICFGSYHLAYPMRPDSPFWRNMEYYLYRMHSSGMIQYYESTSFDYAVHARLLKRYSQVNDFTSAGMEHLIVVFLMLLVMLGLSTLVFLGETIQFRVYNKFEATFKK